jgi:fermentation-respiration switch protein FrsA (DUF1100 family)
VATPAEGGAILLVALRRGNLKYSASYRAGTLDDLYASPPLEEALYDLAADPDERHDLLPEAEGAAHVLRETLRRYLEAARARLAESAEEELSLDPELRRKLESLGYIER